MDTRDHESLVEDHFRNPHVAYERRDLGWRNILLFLAILFIAGVMIHLIVWGLFRMFTGYAVRNDPEPHPMVSSTTLPPERTVLENNPGVNLAPFPEPRLQADDIADFNKYKLQDEQILHSTPWRDKSGALHIPIDRAMELVAKQGPPARTSQLQPSSAVAMGTTKGGAPLQQTDSGNVNLNNMQNARPQPGVQPPR